MGDGGPENNTNNKKAPRDFDFGKILGEGSYSTVIYAKERSTDREFAVKILDKKHIIKEKKVKYVQIEKDVLNRVSHPFVIRLFYTFQSSSSLYFVLEYASNGDLLGLLRTHVFDPPACQFYTAEIVEGVQYLHGKGVIHRDLKPENVLISSTMHIKIADFGTAKIMATPSDGSEREGVSESQGHESSDPDGSKKNSFVGTAEYCSPELLNDRAASYSSDIWAIGCILFQLCSGRPPFKGNNEYQTFQKIIKLEYSFPSGFPQSARSLVEQILDLQPERRPSFTEIKSSPFFDGMIEWSNLPLATPPNLQPQIKSSSSDALLSSDEELLMMTSDLAIDDGGGPGEIGAELHYPYEVADVLPHPNGDSDAMTVHYQREQALLRQKSSPLSPLVEPNELIVLAGSVFKRKGLFVKKRGLMLTDKPRLCFFDEDSFSPKQEIPWHETLTVQMEDRRNFIIHTPKRSYYLRDIDQNAQRWVDAVDNVKGHPPSVKEK
ncbi:3-phosphoinositide dependent protein kinase-1 [Blyttiomyces sp. JEL0837]|nr:3-phosphoinositide dependent protein kinase-1 [Blyttiomyces sp. JEL0837]